MQTTWQKGMRLPEHPALSENTETEVAIIGSGITGITLAYLLAKAGKKVVVVDKGTLLESVTAKTTAFLATDIDTDLSDLAEIFGKDKARDVWQSHADAIEDTAKIIKEENIDCEFVRVPEYFYATSRDGAGLLRQEEVLARGFGFPVSDLSTKNLPLKNFGGFILENQAKFHPLKYLHVLREKAEKLGAVFYENTEATDVGARMVTTPKGIISCEYSVIATYLPIKNPWRIFARKGMYFSYVYELEIPIGALPEGLYLDDQNPYHYFRVDKTDSGMRMIIGGEDHRKELGIDPQKNFEALEDYVRERLPGLTYEIKSKWRGPVLESIDGLAFIGAPDKSEPNLMVATAFSGNGMTYAMIAAKILSEQILGGQNKYAELYSPYRQQFTARGLWIKTIDYLEIFIGGWLKNVFRKIRREVVLLED